MRTIILKQGDFVVDKNKNFLDLKNSAEPAGLKMAIQAFLVITGDDYILLDTGLNLFEGEKPLLFSLLEKESILPSQITKVLLSHLHKDHSGNIGRFDGERFVTNFPNATVYIQRRELEDAMRQAANPSYDITLLEGLGMLPNVQLLEDDNGAIANNILYEVTGGHTPFHQAFWIKEAESTVFYAGDNLPQNSYLEFNISYKSDDDGKKASLLRQEWKERAEKEHWTLLLYHDIKTPILQL